MMVNRSVGRARLPGDGNRFGKRFFKTVGTTLQERVGGGGEGIISLLGRACMGENRYDYTCIEEEHEI